MRLRQEMSWQEEAATKRRVDDELHEYGQMKAAAIDDDGILTLTNNKDRVLTIPQRECTPHVIAHILCKADFGDYETLIRLIETGARLTFIRSGDDVQYLASGLTRRRTP